MQFDPDNKIVKLCAEGMALEGKGQPAEAYQLFLQAWNESTTDFEKFTSAHYVARHQQSAAEKLLWDKTALQLALQMNEEGMKAYYPSLYLNIAKCNEDMHDYNNAAKNYEQALAFAGFLPEDGYGDMIKVGIKKGIEKVENK